MTQPVYTDVEVDPDPHDTVFIHPAPEDDDDFWDLAENLTEDVWPEEYRTIIAKLDAKRVFNWIMRVHEGTRLVYHEGNLMADRLSNPTADIVAKLMAEAAKRNLVELTQSRYKGHSLYRARRTGFALRSKDTRALERILKEALK